MSERFREAIDERGSSPIKGDSRDLQQLLTSTYGVNSVAETVDVAITSPPYADQKTYEANRESQIGLDESYDDYLQNLKAVFSNVYEVMEDTGTLWVVVNSFKRDHRMVDLPGDIIDVCTSVNSPEYCPQCESTGLTVPVESSPDGTTHSCPNCGEMFTEDGWLLQDIVVWDKVRALPYSSKGSFRNVFEYIICFSKTEEFSFELDSIRNPNPADLKEWWVNYPERYHPRGKLPDNIWSMVTPSQGAFSDSSVDHPAPFPPMLVERILQLTTETEDIILDPFAGSGTVLAQAAAMNRRPVGVELSEVYIDRYETLKDEIASKWDSRLENDDALRAKQERFTKVISSLRQTRYCRELIRALGKELNQETDAVGIEALVHQPTALGDPTENPQSYLEMDLKVLYDEEALPVSLTVLKDTIARIQTEDPCTSFGIDASIEYTPLGNAGVTEGIIQSSSSWKKDTTGYLYVDGTHNEYAATGSIESLVTHLAESTETQGWAYPPVISPIGISVPHPKTVCSECSEYEFSIDWPELETEKKPPAPTF